MGTFQTSEISKIARNSPDYTVCSTTLEMPGMNYSPVCIKAGREQEKKSGREKLRIEDQGGKARRAET